MRAPPPLPPPPCCATFLWHPPAPHHPPRPTHTQTLGVGWLPWGSLGGEASSGPTVATRADGLLDVYVRGADRNLYRKSQLSELAAANGTIATAPSSRLRWGSWEFLGGPVQSFPC